MDFVECGHHNGKPFCTPMNGSNVNEATHPISSHRSFRRGPNLQALRRSAQKAFWPEGWLKSTTCSCQVSWTTLSTYYPGMCDERDGQIWQSNIARQTHGHNWWLRIGLIPCPNACLHVCRPVCLFVCSFTMSVMYACLSTCMYVHMYVRACPYVCISICEH